MRWFDYVEIAEELYQRYPGEDVVSISERKVEELVVGLPGFSDKGSPPPPDILSAILTVWIQLQEPGEPDDGRWDAYI